MYGWLWRHLPGSTTSRAVLMSVLAVVVLVICVRWVFPALADDIVAPGQTIGGADRGADRGAVPGPVRT